MQDMNWNDLRYAQALAREKSFSRAARILKIDATTVARRLRHLEAALGARLFERDAAGDLYPTTAGEIVIARARTVEGQLGAMAAALQGGDAAITGTVRVTAVPILINRVLTPALPGLFAQHPGLRLELIAEPRDVDLNRREADIAIRLARPSEEAGQNLIAKRIGTLDYAVYAARSCTDATLNLPWIGYEEGMAHLPQARWITRVGGETGSLAPISVNDAEALLQAVHAGLGRSLLPRIVGDRLTDLTQLACDMPLPAREIWLLTHPDLKHLARIATVTAWIAQSLRL